MSDRGNRRRGFTLIEMALVVIIVALLTSLTAVAVSRVVTQGRVTAERQFLNSVRMGVDKFQQDFGFLPPLVRDGPPTTTQPGPLTTAAPRQPVVRSEAFLRFESDVDEPRYSEYSLTYYLMGVLDVLDGRPGSPKAIDGVAGPGFTRPNPDGTFSQRGATIPALYDPSSGRQRLHRDPGDPARVKILDRWGNPVRFYRWLPQYHATGVQLGEVRQYHVPRSVGDPNSDPALRGATFAIVSLGPDAMTDERKPLPTAGQAGPSVDNEPLDETVKDNLVEVGR